MVEFREDEEGRLLLAKLKMHTSFFSRNSNMLCLWKLPFTYHKTHILDSCLFLQLFQTNLEFGSQLFCPSQVSSGSFSKPMLQKTFTKKFHTSFPFYKILIIAVHSFLKCFLFMDLQPSERFYGMVKLFWPRIQLI